MPKKGLYLAGAVVSWSVEVSSEKVVLPVVELSVPTAVELTELLLLVVVAF